MEQCVGLKRRLMFLSMDANNPQRVKRGAFIYRNDAKAKNNVNSSFRVP